MVTRPLKMPGARASKAVLRERLALALERIAELETLFQRAHGVHHGWVERALVCRDRDHNPTQEDTNAST